MQRILALAVVAALGFAGCASFTRAEDNSAPTYVCHKVAQAPEMQGRLDAGVWKDVPWTTYFKDIEGDKRPAPRFKTRAKMAWDDQCLYIAAELEEPQVWATIRQRDAVMFHDNDFEVFLDPKRDNHEYAELEINAFGTPWDLLLPTPYRDGGSAMDAWDIVGLKVAATVHGTINDPRDTDQGWVAEIAIPFKALAIPRHGTEPPQDGDQWHVNFSRVEWQVTTKDGKYQKVPGKPESNWVWSPTGIIDIHWPEKWGTVQFSAAPAGTAVAVKPDPFAAARHTLHEIYYAQRAYFTKHGRWARTLTELGLAPPLAGMFATGPEIKLDGFIWVAQVQVALPDGSRKTASIRQDSWFRIEDIHPER